MDRMGIAIQAISPMPQLFSYWMDPIPANDLLRYVNDQIAAFVTEANGRMLSFGAVPLQDLDLALQELHRLKGLRFVGVEIGSNVNGEPLGSTRFEPFFQAVNELELAIFVHAVRPTGMDRIHGPKPLQQVLGYPTDVGLAAASLVCSNLMVQFPQLRIAFSHGGGTFASLLPRFSEGYRVFPAVKEALAVPPEEQARRFFYDTLVFDSRMLRLSPPVVRGRPADDWHRLSLRIPRERPDRSASRYICQRRALQQARLPECAAIPEDRRGVRMRYFPVCEIQSIAIAVPDLAAAETFYTEAWGLELAERKNHVVYLRASTGMILTCWPCIPALSRRYCGSPLVWLPSKASLAWPSRSLTRAETSFASRVKTVDWKVELCHGHDAGRLRAALHARLVEAPGRVDTKGLSQPPVARQHQLQKHRGHSRRSRDGLESYGRSPPWPFCDAIATTTL